jgi:hypothetical protein
MIAFFLRTESIGLECDALRIRPDEVAMQLAAMHHKSGEQN